MLGVLIGRLQIVEAYRLLVEQCAVGLQRVTMLDLRDQLHGGAENDRMSFTEHILPA